MPNSNRFKMSQERLDALKDELYYLETVREKEVSELIKEARSFGDLSENSEYDEAKTEQGKLYSKIAELKVLIENAEIVDNMDENTPKDAITLGSIVKVRDIEEDFEETLLKCVRVTPEYIRGISLKHKLLGFFLKIFAPLM